VTPPDTRSADFETQRPRLLRLGYRMLGSLAEAEDVVQDAWLRWAGVEESVDQPSAYLTRIVTRLCLDRMRSAKARREVYVGAWLPDPLVGSTEDEEKADDITLTLMLALERLSPLERAAFLLHDVFDVPLGEVAGTLDRDAAAVRQLASRARKHVKDAKPRYTVDEADAERITKAFFAASRDGDVTALRSLLAEDVVLTSDGGGRVIAFHNPIRGLAKLLRLYAGLKRKSDFNPKLLTTAVIDGLPGYVSLDRGDILQTTAFEIRQGRIQAIYITRNPDKLGHVAALAEGLSTARR